MRILFLGDLVGRSGRDKAIKDLPDLKTKLKADFVIVNVENAAGGYGINKKIADEVLAAGADCLTTGNHIWDQKDAMTYIASEKRLLRPFNFPEGTPGFGAGIYPTSKGKNVLVVNAMGRLFMDPLDCPFQKMNKLLETYQLGRNIDAIFVDFHAEATSEKMGFGHFTDGRVSAVVGTHTHIPTADLRILEKGTAYQTDAGMCADYDSVIGMEKQSPVQRFLSKMPTAKLTPALKEATLSGCLIEIDDKTGLAVKTQQIITGPHLHNCGL